ncbi:hypothetical protein [Brachybacterium subflavum]|uniref:hypothetical protein n=1 Tax=Brachybacterium subflavum TaxID=2585206 RepID=UPI0012661845|nr:hypothetical protein [Brachybacterium subflavum]
MIYVVVALYVAAAALSLAGSIGPWAKDRKLARRWRLAQEIHQDMESRRANLYASGHHDESRQIEQEYNELKDKKFEGGPETLEQLVSTSLFGGGSIGSKAAEAERSRRAGLVAVGLGVALGCLASLLSLILPSS